MKTTAKHMRTFTVNCYGSDEAAFEDARTAALLSITHGNYAGADSNDGGGYWFESSEFPDDLAARCERLEAENAALRDAFRQIFDLDTRTTHTPVQDMRKIASIALASTTPNLLYEAAPKLKTALERLLDSPNLGWVKTSNEAINLLKEISQS